MAAAQPNRAARASVITLVSGAVLAGGAYWLLHSGAPSGVSSMVEPEATIAGEIESDRDWLPDSEELRIGTDPHRRDTDGDALWDGWEVRGVHGIDLPGKGADPRRIDVFVRIDYMRHPDTGVTIMPSQAVLDRARAVFEAAPVANPNGQSGIALHIEIGNAVAFDEDLDPLWPEFDALKRLDEESASVYHYCLWGWRIRGGTQSGASFVGEPDFVVSLGGFGGGTDGQKLGSFLHELGHSLGLDHGGVDGVGYKPNYFSVMNYLWQLQGRYRDGRLGSYGFQDFDLPPLDERDLVESRGLGSGNPPLPFSIYLSKNPPSTVPATGSYVSATGAVDWDGNGNIASGSYQRDLNWDGQLDVLMSTNDWAQMKYDGNGRIGRGQTFTATDSTGVVRMRRRREAQELSREELENLHPKQGSNGH